MTNQDEIRQEFERLIRQTQIFENAKLLYREEVIEDDDRGLTIFFIGQTPRPDEIPYDLDFRVYPFKIIIKWHVRSPVFLESQNDQDATRIATEIYGETIMGLVKNFKTSTEDNHAYFVRQVGSLTQEPPPANKESNDVQRLSTIWEFHTAQEYEV